MKPNILYLIMIKAKAQRWPVKKYRAVLDSLFKMLTKDLYETRNR